MFGWWCRGHLAGPPGTNWAGQAGSRIRQERRRPLQLMEEQKHPGVGGVSVESGVSHLESLPLQEKVVESEAAWCALWKESLAPLRRNTKRLWSRPFASVAAYLTVCIIPGVGGDGAGGG